VKELLAHNATIAQMEHQLGADRLIFQDLAMLIEAAREGNSSIKQFEDSIFTGRYLTESPNFTPLSQLATRHSRNQATQHAHSLILDLH
jgi:amidophosphoribosyltransferase